MLVLLVLIDTDVNGEDDAGEADNRACDVAEDAQDDADADAEADAEAARWMMVDDS